MSAWPGLQQQTEVCQKNIEITKQVNSLWAHVHTQQQQQKQQV